MSKTLTVYETAGGVFNLADATPAEVLANRYEQAVGAWPAVIAPGYAVDCRNGVVSISREDGVTMVAGEWVGNFADSVYSREGMTALFRAGVISRGA